MADREHQSKGRNRRQVKELLNVVEDMRTVLDTLTKPAIAELVRFGEQSAAPDGYPSSSRGGGGGSGDPADPTIRAVAQRVGEAWDAAEAQRQRDVIGEKLTEIVASLYEGRALLRKIHKQRLSVIHSGSLVKDRPTSVTQACECCGRPTTGDGEDRLKSGYGPCCYMPFKRWKNDEIKAGREPSDRSAFEFWHKGFHQPPKSDEADTLDGEIGTYRVDELDSLQAAGVLPQRQG